MFDHRSMRQSELKLPTHSNFGFWSMLGGRTRGKTDFWGKIMLGNFMNLSYVNLEKRNFECEVCWEREYDFLNFGKNGSKRSNGQKLRKSWGPSNHPNLMNMGSYDLCHSVSKQYIYLKLFEYSCRRQINISNLITEYGCEDINEITFDSK